VNVLVSGFRADAPDHVDMAAWLERAVNDPEPLAVSDAVLAGVVRILTHARIFQTPTPLETALDQVQALRDHAGTTVLLPGPRHWDLIARLCREGRATGNLVADASHAAIAMEHGATFISKDRDFARFPGLRWRHPLA
jgi:toxin-antitoxin system PIN domain toxin